MSTTGHSKKILDAILTRSSSQQLVKDDINRVEPIQRSRPAALRDLIAVAFAKIPQSHLIEIMQTEGPGNRVDELSLRYGSWYYVAQIQFDKVDAAQNRAISTCIADLDQDDKN